MITVQIPRDAHPPRVVMDPKIKNPFFDLGWGAQCDILRTGLTVNEQLHEFPFLSGDMEVKGGILHVFCYHSS